MAIYMEYEGIKGNVTAAGYEGMIKLDFVQFGVQRAISMKTGTMANRAHTLPKFSILKTGKKLECSTPQGYALDIHYTAQGRCLRNWGDNGNYDYRFEWNPENHTSLNDQLITQVERDTLGREVKRTQGNLDTQTGYDPQGRLQRGVPNNAVVVRGKELYP